MCYASFRYLYQKGIRVEGEQTWSRLRDTCSLLDTCFNQREKECFGILKRTKKVCWEASCLITISLPPPNRNDSQDSTRWFTDTYLSRYVSLVWRLQHAIFDDVMYKVHRPSHLTEDRITVFLGICTLGMPQTCLLKEENILITWNSFARKLLFDNYFRRCKQHHSWPFKHESCRCHLRSSPFIFQVVLSIACN